MPELGTYVCELCGGTFDKTISDEEALEEMVEVFGEASLDQEQAMLCDPCYNLFLAAFN